MKRTASKAKIKLFHSKDFDKSYFNGGNYEHYEEIASVWTGRVARRIKKTFPPDYSPKVLDVGCAQGYLLSKMCELGCEASGLEYSDYAIKNALPSMKKYIRKGSILEAKYKRGEFDAVVCFNVLEYMPEAKVEKALSNLVLWAKQYIFFTTCFTHSLYSTQKHSPDNLRITVKTEKEWEKLFKNLGAAFAGKFYDGGGGDVLVFRKK
ncbi:MAG: class I SAM-dependent methyltransferase [Acidobacteriaceae bacterium]